MLFSTRVILFFSFTGRKENDKSMIARMLNRTPLARLKKIGSTFAA